ncbi:unnamed protein product, partial [Ectocarpus sp. 13 AM-2016]
VAYSNSLRASHRTCGTREHCRGHDASRNVSSRFVRTPARCCYCCSIPCSHPRIFCSPTASSTLSVSSSLYAHTTERESNCIPRALLLILLVVLTRHCYCGDTPAQSPAHHLLLCFYTAR